MSKVKEYINSYSKLFTRNLLFLINSMVFSEFGNVIYSTALNFWILDITGSTVLLGWLSFVCIIPQLCFSPFIGVYVDRHNNKKIIVLMDILRGISMCIFGFITLFRINNISFIILNSIILAISNCFYQTSINASAIYIFSKDKFVESNSITGSIINLSEICAASIAGILLSIFSAPILFIINGITFFISAISGSFLKLPYTQPSKTDLKIKDELITSINVIKNTSSLLHLIIIRCFFGFLLQINTILIIPLFDLKYNTVLYGFTNSLKIIGTLISGVILISLKKIFSEKKLLFISIASLVVSFISLADINNTAILFASMFLFGFSMNIYNVLTESNIILLVPEEHRAKALSIIFQIIFFFMGLGSLLGGLIAKNISIPLILTVNSLIILVFFICFYFSIIKNTSNTNKSHKNI